MNKSLQYVIIMIFLASAFPSGAWNVGTEPTGKSAVIEEFTGIHCPNCPDGHLRAAELLRAHHGEVFTIAIHAGPFATPRVNEPNFITSEGTDIHDHFQVNSYPCGVVSRRDVGNGIVQGRGDWGPSARTITREESPVNLYGVASYDADTRMLRVKVEGYYTSGMADPRLTVMLLQNNILGPQSGGMLGVEYPHRHILRDILTNNAFGDGISEKNAGEYFTREISYILPEEIDGIPTVACDMALIAFVSEGEGEIVKAFEFFPEADLSSDQRKIVVPASALIPVGSTYALDYLELWLDNYSGEDAVSAKLDFKLNGRDHELIWNGSIPAHGTGLARFPLDGIMKDCYDNDTNEYSILVTEINGRPLALEMLPVKGQFRNLTEYPAEMKIKIKTDLDAADNTYRIIDESGDTVVEFGPYADGVNMEYDENVSLEPGKVYGFEVSDAWGNGVYHPRGSVKFYRADDGRIAGQLMEIADYGMRLFFRTEDTSGIGAIFSEKAIDMWFDMTGVRVSHPVPGDIYIRRTINPDGTIETSKTIF